MIDVATRAALARTRTTTATTPWAALEDSVHRALLTYSNVHRGSGHFSQASTSLFEHARQIVLNHFHRDPAKHVVIFGSAARQEGLTQLLPQDAYDTISSAELGLDLGVHATVVARHALPAGIPLQTGGGAVKLVAPDDVVWDDAPARFEAGTPAIINAIAFARALQLTQRHGPNLFRNSPPPDHALLWQENGSQGEARLAALRHTMLGNGIAVPVTTGEQTYINLDNGASTPCLLPVWDVVRACWRLDEAQRVAMIDEARDVCHRFLGAPARRYGLLFCQCTTEAMNLLAGQLATQWADQAFEPVVLNTWMEHHSNDLPWRYATGVTLQRMPVDQEGFLPLDQLERLLLAYNQQGAYGRKRVRLVAISGASNVLGTCNDLAAIARLTHQYGARLLVDGAQLLSHRPVSLEEMGVDLFAFSAHKGYAPFGSGGLLYRRDSLDFDAATLARLQGSGEGNGVGIAALGEALRQLEAVGMAQMEQEESDLTTYALERLSEIPQLRILGIHDTTSAHLSARGGVISFSVRNVPHNVVARELAERGAIGVRNGCFCAHLISKQLMGIVPWREHAGEFGLGVVPEFTSAVLPGLVRVSLGIQNTPQQLDHLCAILRQIVAARRGPVSRFLAHTYNGLPWQRTSRTQRRIDRYCQGIVREVFADEVFADEVFADEVFVD